MSAISPLQGIKDQFCQMEIRKLEDPIYRAEIQRRFEEIERLGDAGLNQKITPLRNCVQRLVRTRQKEIHEDPPSAVKEMLAAESEVWPYMDDRDIGELSLCLHQKIIELDDSLVRNAEGVFQTIGTLYSVMRDAMFLTNEPVRSMRKDLLVQQQEISSLKKEATSTLEVLANIDDQLTLAVLEPVLRVMKLDPQAMSDAQGKGALETLERALLGVYPSYALFHASAHDLSLGSLSKNGASLGSQLGFWASYWKKEELPLPHLDLFLPFLNRYIELRLFFLHRFPYDPKGILANEILNVVTRMVSFIDEIRSSHALAEHLQHRYANAYVKLVNCFNRQANSVEVKLYEKVCAIWNLAKKEDQLRIDEAPKTRMTLALGVEKGEFYRKSESLYCENDQKWAKHLQEHIESLQPQKMLNDIMHPDFHSRVNWKRMDKIPCEGRYPLQTVIPISPLQPGMISDLKDAKPEDRSEQLIKGRFPVGCSHGLRSMHSLFPNLSYDLMLGESLGVGRIELTYRLQGTPFHVDDEQTSPVSMTLFIDVAFRIEKNQKTYQIGFYTYQGTAIHNAPTDPTLWNGVKVVQVVQRLETVNDRIFITIAQIWQNLSFVSWTPDPSSEGNGHSELYSKIDGALHEERLSVIRNARSDPAFLQALDEVQVAYHLLAGCQKLADYQSPPAHQPLNKEQILEHLPEAMRKGPYLSLGVMASRHQKADELRDAMQRLSLVSGQGMLIAESLSEEERKETESLKKIIEEQEKELNRQAEIIERLTQLLLTVVPVQK